MNWNERTALPPIVRAILQTFRFDAAEPALEAFSAGEWATAIAWCDRMQITLPLADLAQGLPAAIRERTSRDILNNQERTRRQLSALREVHAALRQADIEYIVLKGFTHGSDFVPHPWLRHQTDLDLYAPAEHLEGAQASLLSLGYEPVEGFERFPIDHLPAMIRRNRHRWKGDFFDPELSIVFELHFQLWDERTEKLPAPGLEAFWSRRGEIVVENLTIPALDPQDRLTYAALHALRHLLRGDLKVLHLYEIARFLHLRSGDHDFWRQWEARQSAETMRYAATVFALGHRWFGGEVPVCARSHITELPKGAMEWLRRDAASPVEAFFSPNKDELRLHLALLPEGEAGWSVAARKALPRTLPVPAEEFLSQTGDDGPAERRVARSRYLRNLADRVSHHVRAAPGLISTLLHTVVARQGFGSAYWAYLSTATLYHLGVFVFVLLYNLHIAELGYDERFMGLLTTAMTVGSVAGTLPAGRLVQRLGLRTAITLCCLAAPTIAALRSLFVNEMPLLVLAFGGGMLFSMWVVCIAPTVAQLVGESRRPQAFSLFFAVSIATGVAGGMLGGSFPEWFAGASATLGLSKMQGGLLAGCAVSAASLLPANRIQGLTKPTEERERYPRGAFVRRYIPVVFLWSLATGAFNPFFNIYFARHLELSTLQIGRLFSLGQLTQVGALLAAPALLATWGRVPGIAMAQAAAGGALLFLSLKGPLWIPAVAYLFYMSCQWMCEPGLHSLLMDRVRKGERTAASSLNYTAMFSAHAAAAAVAGWAIARWGYPVVLVAAGSLALAAAALFRLLLGQLKPPAGDASRS